MTYAVYAVEFERPSNVAAYLSKAHIVLYQVISNTGFESPCSTKGESFRFSPLETPSALCPPQEAGFTLNKGLSMRLMESTDEWR